MKKNNKLLLLGILILVLTNTNSYCQIFDTTYHAGIKEYGDKLVNDLKDEFFPLLTKKERKKLKGLKINVIASPDILEVKAYTYKKKKYIDVSTAFLDAINKVTDAQVVEEIVGRKTFVFNFIYDYLFSQSEIRPTIQNYANLNESELAIFNSPHIQELRYDMFRYGVGFVLIHEVAHHIEKHPKKNVKSEKQKRDWEQQADNIAFEIFRRNQQPPIYAGIPLTLFYVMDNDAIVNEKVRTHPADINRLLITYSKNYEYILDLYLKAEDLEEKNNLKKLLTKSQSDIAKINNRLDEDKVRTTDWYMEKADEGLAYAQVKLGHLYTFGENGLKADNEKAMYWFDKAARQGDAYGQYRLAMMYELYRLDKKSAFYWYHESAKQGNYFAKLAIENMNKKE